MKYIWRSVYFLHFAAPVAYSISLYLLYQRASLLLGSPPQVMINSPDSFVGDATFNRLDNFVALFAGASWLLFIFGSLPVLFSSLWPVAFRSRLARFAIFVAFLLCWWYWAADPKGAWYID